MLIGESGFIFQSPSFAHKREGVLVSQSLSFALKREVFISQFPSFALRRGVFISSANFSLTSLVVLSNVFGTFCLREVDLRR